MKSDDFPSNQDLNNISEPEIVAETRTPYNSTGGREVRGYRQLKVWQVSMDLMAECYRLSGAFPREDMFGLTRQLRTAAVSVSLNIAEGWGRNGRAEFARFSDIARASANEVEAAVEVALRLGFLSQGQLVEFYRLLDKVCAMLFRLIESLRKDAN